MRAKVFLLETLSTNRCLRSQVTWSCEAGVWLKPLLQRLLPKTQSLLFRMVIMRFRPSCQWKSQDLMRTSMKKSSMMLMSLQKSHYLPASVRCNYLLHTVTILIGLYRSAMDPRKCRAAASATYLPNSSQEVSLSKAIRQFRYLLCRCTREFIS